MCMENGKVKPERKEDSWFAPVNLWHLVGVVAIGLTVLWNLFAYEARTFDSSEQKYEVIEHVGEIDVHQPYKEKLKEWYTRPEGTELEKRVKELEEMKRLVEEIHKATVGK